jgi:hypothetical protein
LAKVQSFNAEIPSSVLHLSSWNSGDIYILHRVMNYGLKPSTFNLIEKSLQLS